MSEHAAEKDALVERIRAEAGIASRSGQHDRLNQIADEVARLQRGAQELGKSLVVWMELAVAATGSEDLIEEDGDGDWGAVADRMAELSARVNPSGKGGA